MTEAAKTTLPNLAPFAPVGSQADAGIDVTISAECQSASPVATPSGVVVAERDSVGAEPANGEAPTFSGADTKVVPASEDASDSIATITAASVARAAPVPSSSKSARTPAGAAETLLTSLSHDQFTFAPTPAFTETTRNSGMPPEDDAVLVDNSSEGGSVRSVEHGWTTEFDA